MKFLEGMMPNDLSLTTAEGFLVNPPDMRSKYAKDLCAAQRIGVVKRTGRDRGQSTPAERDFIRHAASPTVRRVRPFLTRTCRRPRRSNLRLYKTTTSAQALPPLLRTSVREELQLIFKAYFIPHNVAASDR